MILTTNLPTGWVRRRVGRIGALGRQDRVALGALAALVLLIVVGAFIAPQAETRVVGKPLTPPSFAYPLGLDDQGRDVLSRTLVGARTSLIAIVVVITSGVIVGGAVGIFAGIVGGHVDALLMRLTDVFLALPGVLLALAVVAALGASLQHTILAIIIVWWPWYARIVRGEVKTLMSRPHVEAARLGGIGSVRIARRHVLPGVRGPVIVAASLDVGVLLLTLAGLTFIGLGSPPPAAELGSMVSRGMKYLFTAPWLAVVPAILIFLLALVANLAGDAVRNLQDR